MWFKRDDSQLRMVSHAIPAFNSFDKVTDQACFQTSSRLTSLAVISSTV